MKIGIEIDDTTFVTVKSMLMTTKMNSEIDNGEIVRVNNWKEIYDEIEQYRKQRNEQFTR